MEVNGYRQLFEYPYSFKYLLVCVVCVQQKKETYTGLEQLKGKQKLSFLCELSL